MKKLFLVISIVLIGCAGPQHKETLSVYKGKVLPIPGEGEKRLTIEKDYDDSIQLVVENMGTPDYIYVASRTRLKLFYVEDNHVVTFQRPASSSNSLAKVSDPIPSRFVRKFKKQDRETLTGE